MLDNLFDKYMRNTIPSSGCSDMCPCMPIIIIVFQSSRSRALCWYLAVALLLVYWDGRVRSRLVNCLVWYDALHLHHRVEFLSCLLELLLCGRVVGIWTHRTHCVRSRLRSHHGAQPSNHSRLVLNLDMDRIVRVRLPSIGHRSLRAGSTLHCHATTHLPRRLEDLLASTAPTSIHGIVHHAGLVELTVCLSIERIVLIVLAVHTLGSTSSRPFQVLALHSVTISIAWTSTIIGDYAASNHSKCTRVLALPGHLLYALAASLAWQTSSSASSYWSRCSGPSWGQGNDAAGRLHGTHG